MFFYEQRVPFDMRAESKNEFSADMHADAKILSAYQRAGNFYFLIQENEEKLPKVTRTFCAFCASHTSDKYSAIFDPGANRAVGYIGGDHCLGSTVHIFEVKEKEKPK